MSGRTAQSIVRGNEQIMWKLYGTESVNKYVNRRLILTNQQVRWPSCNPLSSGLISADRAISKDEVGGSSHSTRAPRWRCSKWSGGPFL